MEWLYFKDPDTDKAMRMKVRVAWRGASVERCEVAKVEIVASEGRWQPLSPTEIDELEEVLEAIARQRLHLRRWSSLPFEKLYPGKNGKN